MFCNNCGFQLPDGTKFCNNCGKPTTAPQPPATNNQLPPELQSTRQQAPAYAPVQQGGYPQPNAGYPLPPMDYSPIVTPPPKKKKSKVPFIILGVVAALVIVVIIGALTSGSSFTPEHGTIDGNVYTNESLEIKFEKPDGWTFATDKELAEMSDNGISASEYDDFATLLDEHQYVYEMFAQSPLGSSTMIAIEDISADPGISYEDYLNNSEDVIGSTVTFSEITEKTIAGKEFKFVDATVSTMGVEVPVRCYFRKYNNYMVTIFTGGLSDSALDEIEDMFSAIE